MGTIERLGLDKSLMDATELIDDEYLALKQEAKRTIDDFCARVWKDNTGKAPGRREVKDRDDLIVKLARLFHERSGWNMKFEDDALEDGWAMKFEDDALKDDDEDDESYVTQYQRKLVTFIALMLVDYDGIPFSAVGVLDKVPTQLRHPRDTRKKARA